MEQRGSKFFIAQVNQARALEAALELCNHPEMMRGGSWRGETRLSACFSWVDMDKFKAAENLVKAIKCWGWEPSVDAEGNITGINFAREKSGQENLLFDAIAPFVQDGSYIEMSGEDDVMWRWVFKGGECHEVTPTITWED
jgi:hypothetical protein